MRYEFRRQQDAWDLVRFLGIQGSSGEMSCSWRNAHTVTAGRTGRTKALPPSTCGLDSSNACGRAVESRGICLTLARDFGYMLIPEVEAATWSRKTYRTLKTPKRADPAQAAGGGIPGKPWDFPPGGGAV